MFVKDERVLDQITAISGSGPAYFYYFAESLIKAGINLGLTSQKAYRLTTQTFIGSAKLLEASENPLQDLRRAVTSKGGTTEAALNVFGKSRLDIIVSKGAKAAYRRAQEL